MLHADFIIANPGMLPVKWRLAGADALPKEFAVFPAAGELEARSEVKVAVEFKALEKRDCTSKITLEVLDKAELHVSATGCCQELL